MGEIDYVLPLLALHGLFCFYAPTQVILLSDGIQYQSKAVMHRCESLTKIELADGAVEACDD